MGVCGQRHALAAFTPGKDLVPIVWEANSNANCIFYLTKKSNQAEDGS
jgi:hypothetical protein